MLTTTDIHGTHTARALPFPISSANDGYLLSQVAMGASHAVAPDGQVYILKWVQDDNGRLHLQDHKLDTLTDYGGGRD